MSAILLVVATGILFSCLDTSAKYLVLSGMAAPFVSWVRFAVHVVLVLVLFRGWRNPAMFRAVNLPTQVLRGVFLFGSTIFNFLALQTLQLAETTSIFFFAPMVITALAGPLLGEWAGWRRWLAIIAGFVGVLVITRPGVGVFEHRPRLCALRDAFSYCFYVIMTRRMAATRDAGKPDLLFGAGAGDPDAAGRAVHGLAAAGSVALADPAVARLLRRVRPLAADPRLPHGDDLGAGALSLSADGLDDLLRLCSSSTSCPTAGRLPARRSSWPAASTSCTASTGCG